MFTERDVLLKKDFKVEVIHPCAPEQYLHLHTEIDHKYKPLEQMGFMISDKKLYSSPSTDTKWNLRQVVLLSVEFQKKKKAVWSC